MMWKDMAKDMEVGASAGAGQHQHLLTTDEVLERCRAGVAGGAGTASGSGSDKLKTPQPESAKPVDALESGGGGVAGRVNAGPELAITGKVQ